MSTLTVMKQRISAELRRSNISSQIASAITSAIEAMEHERFVFNETREITFDTVAAQEFYDGDDAALIPRIVKFDYVKVLIGTDYFDLAPIYPSRIEDLNGDATFEGQPNGYCFYQEQILIYPVPSDVYTIRIGALVSVPAPASDEEADNPWMTKAERAVRCRAKYELYEHVLLNDQMAQRFHPENEMGPTYEALRQLRVRTNRLTSTGGWDVVPTQF